MLSVKHLIIHRKIVAIALALLFSASSALSQQILQPSDFGACTERLTEASRNEYCGFIDLPADHFHRTHGQFVIPFRWIESPNPHADNLPPVMWFNGGPGVSNLVRPPMAGVLSEFNVLLIGFRGIDGGPDLTCPQIEHAITGARRILQDGVPAVADAIDDCLDELSLKGYRTEYFSIAQTIHDADFVRAALGIDRVHIIAGSFGTRLGLIYQENFPKSVARSVFIGANPPGRTIWTPKAVDAVWQRVASKCLARDACDADPAEMLAALRYRVETNARFFGFEFDDERARVASFLLAYDAELMPYIADAFLDAYRGNQAGLFMLSVAHDFAIKSSGLSWGHFVLMAASSDYQAIQDYDTLLSPSESAPFGSPLAALFWPAIPNERISLIDEKYRKLTVRLHDTLLISGELDISAPFEQIENSILPYRPNAVHWIVPDSGHYNLYLSDIMAAASEFLMDGNAVQPANPKQLSLKPRFGFAEMLNLAIATILILIMLLGGILVWRISRKRH